MLKRHTIDQNLVLSLFEYRDGELYWKKTTSPRSIKGNKAGTIRKPQNYKYVGIDKKYFLVHRLIFLYHHGYMPDYIDHIDGNVNNNKIENLRICSQTQNQYNAKKSKINTSGFKGVSQYKSNGLWYAKIYINNQLTRKSFKNKDDAINWSNNMRKQYHGEFCRL